MVSIHAPAWGATWRFFCCIRQHKQFQSTHPRGVRLSPRCQQHARYCCFNPRTRVGCDPRVWRQNGFPAKFQSTHPRGVRRDGGRLTVDDGCVSIHAPAWGATEISPALEQRPSVSIHAPAWGATSPRRPCRAPWPGFNPRTRVGCDDASGNRSVWGADVSIHAPAWGATGNQTLQVVLEGQFQSTHPRGVRRQQSRRWRKKFDVSIHAPAWGATGWASAGRPAPGGFNPRTRVGCDCFHVLSSRFP